MMKYNTTKIISFSMVNPLNPLCTALDCLDSQFIDYKVEKDTAMSSSNHNSGDG